MKIVMISDVHEQWHDLVIPSCDLLISAGDYSYRGKPQVVVAYHKWLDQQNAGYIISVQGNHELWVEKNYPLAKDTVRSISPSMRFVEEGLGTDGALKIWCSAYTPRFHDWAYNVDRGAAIKAHWDRIPDDTEILITHGPPLGIMDQIVPGQSEHLGCADLMKRIVNLPKLKLHVFGHIHGSSGECDINGVRFVNASICNEQYQPVNQVREWIYDR